MMKTSALSGWAVASAFYLCDLFLRLSVDVVRADIQREFNMTASRVSSAFGSSFFWSYAAMQLPIGWILDVLGPSRTIASCSFLAATASIAFGFAKTVTFGVLARVLMGIASSAGWLGALKVARNGYGSGNRKGNFVLGLTCMLGGIGGLVSQEPFRVLANALSWRTAFKVSAALPLAISICSLLFISDEASFESDDVPVERKRDVKTRWVDVVKAPRMWLCAVFLGTTDGPFELFAGLWGASYLKQAAHFSPSKAGTATTILVIVATAGQLAGGPMLSSCLISRKRQIASLILLALAGFVAMILPAAHIGSSPVAAWTSTILLGVSVTSCTVVWNVISSDVLCRGSASTGLVSGMVNTLCISLDAILQIIFGSILTANWSGQVDAKGDHVYSAAAYAKAFLPMAVYFGVAAACMSVMFGCAKRLYRHRDDSEDNAMREPILASSPA